MKAFIHREGLGSARILRAGFGILPKPQGQWTHIPASPSSLTVVRTEEVRGKMPRTTRWKRALPMLLACAFPLFAAEKPKSEPRTPERTELWVPSEELARVLEKSENKNAVLLTPEQYNALIRDAGKLKPDDLAKPPPTNAVVESIRLKGRVLDGESGITLHGEITAKALADDWSLVNVKLPWRSVGKLSTTGGALLDVPAESKKTTSLATASALSLFVKGPAAHRVAFDCVAPINHGGSPDERVLYFEPTSVPTVLELTLPAGAQVTQGPSRETVGDVHRFILNTSASGTSIIAWRLQPPAGSAAHVTTQSLRGSCRVAESELVAAYDVLLSSTATDAPTREIAFNVTPASASVIAVEGEKVESWTQTNGALAVKLSGEARSLQLRVELRMPVTLPAKDTLPIELPAVVLGGAKQVPAIAEIGLDEGVEMLELRSSRGLAASVAEWDAASEKATAIIRKVSPRIVVDADARIFVSRDFAEIERIVNATSDVPIDHLKANLPADEELLEVNWQSGPKLEWKRVGQSVEIEWQQRVDARHASKFTIKSRKKLPSDAKPVTITNLTIDDAKKLAGYIALDHDPAWRVALKQTSGLEDRDARLTPVSGKMAWFSLRECTLGIELQRRESVVDAEITAYALPRAKSVEIEGQIALDITGAPLRQIEVRVTKEQAKLLRFTSPLIAEQAFDETTGAWKLTLARETTGRVNLRWRSTVAVSLRETSGKQANTQNINAPKANTPGANTPNASAPANAPTELVSRSETATMQPETATLTVTLPRFEIPAARRFRGSWVVEANTDTQLSFATQSLQRVDVMRVPAVEDYTPRHRLVAAFTYGSGAHELTLTAKRHASSELAALVISKLALTSVLGVDGGSKHEAVIDLRHSGEQFAHVRLPSGAQLLSIIVDGRAVKPVRGEGGAIAIPLPGGTAGRDTVTARLIYELPGDPWPGHGTRKLDPITFLGDAPVLATDWRVHVPDGFSYDKVATRMEQSGTFEPEGIVPKVAALVASEQTFASPHQSQIKTDYAPGLEMPLAPDAIKKANKNALPLEEKLKRVIIPQLSFVDATIEDSIEFLRLKLAGVDTYDGHTDPELKATGIVFSDDFSARSSKITIDLKDVSFKDALGYICEIAGVKYSVQPGLIVIAPIYDSKLAESKDAIENRSSGDLHFKSGLIPLELDLPSSGQVLRFSGSQAPEVLELRFTSWERQMAWACWLMAAGGLVFALWGRRRAMLRTLLVVLVLSLGVKLFAEERLPLANAALFGWLAALGIWVVFRLCAGIQKRTGGVSHVEA